MGKVEMKGSVSFLISLVVACCGLGLLPAQERSPDSPRATLTDSLGRRVVVPAKVERIISLEPEITRIIVALGGGERLISIDFFLRHFDHLFPIVFPRGRELPVVSNQGQDLNYEMALHLRPDIVFLSPSEFQSPEATQSRLGAPVAVLASIGKFDGLVREIEIVGRMIGREERAAELVGYFRRRISDVGRIVGPIPAEERPRVYLSFWGSLLRTPVAYEPVEAAGGRNCASGLLPSRMGAAGTMVPVEEILRWDPDLILVQGNYPPAERAVTVEGILSDPRLASLRAVRAGRVRYTFGFWYWWDPALVLVETLYLARLFYPARFPDFDLRREGDLVFKEFYGIDGAFSKLGEVLNCDDWLRE
jgi:iron complex transport system substrate-binding protein